jgi:hypothetical protein
MPPSVDSSKNKGFTRGSTVAFRDPPGDRRNSSCLKAEGHNLQLVQPSGYPHIHSSITHTTCRRLSSPRRLHVTRLPNVDLTENPPRYGSSLCVRQQNSAWSSVAPQCNPQAARAVLELPASDLTWSSPRRLRTGAPTFWISETFDPTSGLSSRD